MNNIKLNFSSAEISFYKIGGLCSYFQEVTTEAELAEAKNYAVENDIKFLVVEDNNFVVDPKGFNGFLVFKNNNNSTEKFIFKEVAYSQEVINNLKAKGVDISQLILDKNKIPAELFIIESGLVGKAIGGFRVSEQNANTLERINDRASFDDFMQLVSYIKQQVRDGLLTQLEEKFIYIY